MSGNGDDAIHLLFDHYLQMKIGEGFFPKGALLPINDFMIVFKLKLSDVLKALFELEKNGVIQIIEKSQAEVLAGKNNGCFTSFNVKDDINRIFLQFSRLESMALNNSWSRIDRGAVRAFSNKMNDEEPSRQLWRTIKVIHAQITDNCKDAELKIRIASLLKELDFFRLLYLDSIPIGELNAHSLTIEAIANAIISGDLDDAHFQLLSQQSQFQEKLLNMFKERYILTYNKREIDAVQLGRPGAAR